MNNMLNKILELMGNRHGAGKELANHLGIHPSVVTDWKAGRNKSYTKYAPQIAEYYNVSLDWLSGLSDEKEQKETAPNKEDGSEKILAIFRSLPDERRKQLEDYAKFLQASEQN